MRWNLTVIDPPGFPFTHFLFDSVRMVAFSLEDLGLDVSITQNKLEPDRVNVLCGVHLLRDERDAEAILDTGSPFVVLQTEMVHGRTINREAGDRLDRVILPLCREARAVWDSSPENLHALAALGIEARLLRFGYQAKMQEIRHRASKDLDFMWYGSITEHRRKVLSELSQLGYRVATVFDAAPLYRNDLIARSEIILTLRQSEAMTHLPHARVLYAVANECVVAGDCGENQEPLEDVFVWSRERGVIDLLRSTRARSDLRELAATHRSRLASRPMKDFMAPLIEGVAA